MLPAVVKARRYAMAMMQYVETCSSVPRTCVEGIEADCVAPCMYNIVQFSIVLHCIL